MEAYRLTVQGPNAADGAWCATLDVAMERLRDPAPILQRIADEVILPALARNYSASGLKQRTGMLFAGVTQRGAKGNYVTVSGNLVTVGVSYEAIPYAKYQLEGSVAHTIRAKNKKFLRFEIAGQVFFRKQVQHPGTPAHLVYRLSAADIDKAYAVAEKYIMEGK